MDRGGAGVRGERGREAGERGREVGREGEGSGERGGGKRGERGREEERGGGKQGERGREVGREGEGSGERGGGKRGLDTPLSTPTGMAGKSSLGLGFERVSKCYRPVDFHVLYKTLCYVVTQCHMFSIYCKCVS